MVRHLVLPLLLSPLVFSCQKPSQTDSQSKIINGTFSFNFEQPAVVAIYQPESDGLCTGTFISDSLLLTAAHCTEMFYADSSGVVDGQLHVIQINDLQSADVKLLASSVKIIRDPRWEEAGAGVNNFDLALIRFPAKTWGTQAAISKNSAEVGDEVEMYGYGQNTDDGDYSSSGVFRKGFNVIESIDGGFIAFRGVASNGVLGGNGTFASAGQGDSGGPLFVDGKIVGVVSGGQSPSAFDEYVTNYYIDLHSNEAQEFLSYAEARL